MRPVDLRGRVLPLHPLADEPVLGDGLERRPAGVRGGERLAAEERAVRDRLRRVVLDRDDAGPHLQLRDRDAELLRREPEQHRTSLGGRLAHLRPTARDRVAAGRRALVRRDVGVPRRGPHLLDRQVELLGRDLQQAGRGAGDVDLAEGDRGGVVRVDRDPRVDQGGVRRACGDARRRALRRAGEHRPDEAEADDERAAALEELLARELRAVDQLGELSFVEQVDGLVAEQHRATPPSPSSSRRA